MPFYTPKISVRLFRINSVIKCYTEKLLQMLMVVRRIITTQGGV